MRKYSFILSAVAVTGLTVVAQAAESNYWFDVRPTAATIIAPGLPFTVSQGEALFAADIGPAGGGRGSGQVLRLCPKNTTSGLHTLTAASYPNFDTDGDASTGDLFLYCDVNANADAPAGTSDVISSIGLDIAVATSAAATRYEIDTVLWSWTLTDPTVPVNYGFAPGVSSSVIAGPRGVTGAKYVKVPVDGASAYATTNGLTVGGPYQLGKLRMVAKPREFVTCTAAGVNVHSANSTYGVTMSVNNLLVTRTFSSGGQAVPEEIITLGYTGGALDADRSGNTSPTVAHARDGAVQVRQKGDTNGSGLVNGLDLGGYTTAQGPPVLPLTQTQRYLYDRNNSGNINGLDLGQYTAAQLSPCP